MNHSSAATRPFRRAALPSGIAIALLSASMAVHAAPVEAGEAADATSLDAVQVVGGSFYQGQEQIENRRKAIGIVDTLAQDDTGDLPDRNIAEALRRVPGVSTLYLEDEGQFLTVRGITPDMNHVTVDGITMISVGSSGEGGRRVDMGLIPSQSSRTSEVYKTFTPNLESGAIGGVINLIPRSAFDHGSGDFVVVDAQANYFDYDKVPGGNNLKGGDDDNLGGGLSAIWARPFGADEQFGIVLAANHLQIQRDLTKYNPNGLLFFDEAGGRIGSPLEDGWNGYRPVPDTARSYDFNNRLTESKGLSARFEYRPSMDRYHSLMLYGYGQDHSENRNEFSLNQLGGVQDQTATSGTLNVGRADSAFFMENIERESRGAIHHSRFTFANDAELDLRAGYTFSSYDNYTPDVRYRYANSGGLLDYRFDGKHFGFGVDDAARYADPSTYTMTSAAFTRTASEADAIELKADYTFNMAVADRGWGYQFGVGTRDFELERDRTVTNYRADPASTLAGLQADSGFTPSHFPLPAMWLDYGAWREQVLPGLAVNEATSLRNSGAADYRYEETVDWGYGTVSYANDRTRVLAGVRYDQADYTGYAPRTVNGVFDPTLTPVSGDYSHWLPSASLLHRIDDGLRLKMAYSRTLGRPDPAQIAAPETRNDDTLTITQGNPSLKPRKSDNYDVALEWFFDESASALTLGVFHKEIQDDIFAMSESVLIDGTEYFSTRPMNSETSRISGVELGYIANRIPGLPGFLRDRVGFQANLMHAKGETNYLVNGTGHSVDRLMDQSDWLANAALFYRLPGDGEVRLAYNYQGANLTTLGTSPWLHRGTDDYDTFDLTVRHRLNDAFMVKFEARNLGNEKRNLAVGQDLEWWRAEGESGRSLYVHLIYRK